MYAGLCVCTVRSERSVAYKKNQWPISIVPLIIIIIIEFGFAHRFFPFFCLWFAQCLFALIKVTVSVAVYTQPFVPLGVYVENVAI